MRFLNSNRNVIAGLAAAGLLAVSAATAATAATGMAEPWQFGFQDAVTPVMHETNWFHNMLLVITGLIAAFVTALMAYIFLRFNAKANPVPSKTSHNTLLEIVWTVVPVLILVAIGIYSFPLLYLQRVIPDADMTIKAVGNQWYWTYEYPDAGDVSFDSVVIDDEDLKPGQPRLLSVDEQIVVPVNKVVRVIVTASDVIHAFAVPAFGVKIDAVPGRINETWFKVEKTGVYYGQCSEMCGIRHAYMPIAVRVVSEADYATWIAGKKAEASAPRNTMIKTAAASSGAAQ